jgi:MFS family permease
MVTACLLPGFLTASVAPRIELDFAFGASAVGLSLALFYVICSGSSMVSGGVVRRLGIRAATNVAAASTAISCLAIAFFADSEAVLIALLMLGGLGNALAGPIAAALVTAKVPAERHGLVFGIQQACAPLGAVLAGLALPLVALPFGWRWGFGIVAALAIGAALAMPPAHLVAAPAHSAGIPARARRPIFVLSLAAVLASASAVGLVGFLVTYAVDNGVATSWAGWLLAGISLIAAGSRIGMGRFADRFEASPLRPVAPMLVGAAIGYVVLIGESPAYIVFGSALVGLLGWSWPASMNHAIVRLAPEATASGVGVMMAGLFAGAVIGPILVGSLADQDHFAVAWLSCAAMALLAAGLVAAAREPA